MDLSQALKSMINIGQGSTMDIMAGKHKENPFKARYNELMNKKVSMQKQYKVLNAKETEYPENYQAVCKELETVQRDMKGWDYNIATGFLSATGLSSEQNQEEKKPGESKPKSNDTTKV